ncbi:hypothetical protein [Yeosuana sp. AK3]
MIKFFRKIRKKLIEQGKTANYLKYAIGEIILVVIGILIALQVNNWNVIRTENKTSLNLMMRLLNESKQNLKAVSNSMLENNKGMDDCEQMLQLFSANYQDKDIRTVDTLIYSLLAVPKLNYKSSTINEALNSGTVSLITSDDLRDLLYQIPSLYSEINWAEENINRDSEINFFPYLYDQISIRQMDATFAPIKDRIGKSQLDVTDNRIILTDRKFENMIDNKMFLLNNLLRQYQNFYNLNKEVISLLKTEINKLKND